METLGLVFTIINLIGIWAIKDCRFCSSNIQKIEELILDNMIRIYREFGNYLEFRIGQDQIFKTCVRRVYNINERVVRIMQIKSHISILISFAWSGIGIAILIGFGVFFINKIMPNLVHESLYFALALFVPFILFIVESYLAFKAYKIRQEMECIEGTIKKEEKELMEG